jgi:signal transduction histidine kinase
VSAVPEGLEVRGISKLLRRAIRNLLENARRYSTGEITVQVLRSGALAEVRVCDRGPGVPLDQRERIFEPFSRLPGASERSGGLGLGLALVRSIAGRHNARIAKTRRWRCRFVLRLPLALTNKARRANSANPQGPAPHHHRVQRHPAPGPTQPPPAL